MITALKELSLKREYEEGKGYAESTIMKLSIGF